nr:MAG TPA: hypothetical protein [Caudoviricetes sp.]
MVTKRNKNIKLNQFNHFLSKIICIFSYTQRIPVMFMLQVFFLCTKTICIKF